MVLKEMSNKEKEILCSLIDESKPLKYPMVDLSIPFHKTEREYIIPDSDKEELLRNLYPFFHCPSIDDELYDMHEDKYFNVRDYRVIRYNNRNILVSPYYHKTGGMVIDWITGEQVEGGDLNEKK